MTRSSITSIRWECWARRRRTTGLAPRLARLDGLHAWLDVVFNHVGRDFWAFRDVRARGSASPYRHWFFLDFGRVSPYGDSFHYEGWNKHYDLVKLDVRHHEVREHLFEAVRTWMEVFGIDGLRLDAADHLDRGFQRDLARFCRAVRPDFWLMGEVIHGDYRLWAGPDALDAVTNYELYKGLYSSHNDANYFEIAYSTGPAIRGAGPLCRASALHLRRQPRRGPDRHAARAPGTRLPVARTALHRPGRAVRLLR